MSVSLRPKQGGPAGARPPPLKELHGSGLRGRPGTLAATLMAVPQAGLWGRGSRDLIAIATSPETHKREGPGAGEAGAGRIPEDGSFHWRYPLLHLHGMPW